MSAAWAVKIKDQYGNVFDLKHTVGRVGGQVFNYLRPAAYKDPSGRKAKQLDEFMLKNDYTKHYSNSGVRYRKEREDAKYDRHKRAKIF